MERETVFSGLNWLIMFRAPRYFAKHFAKHFAVALCAAYLLFALAPHFETLSHSHAHGDRAHHHNFLSAHDVALERAVLAASIPELADAVPQSEVEARTPETIAPRPALPAGTHGLQSGQTSKHSHGQEDPNLLALGSVARAVQLVFAPLPRRETPVTFVTERAALWASARAPPA